MAYVKELPPMTLEHLKCRTFGHSWDDEFPDAASHRLRGWWILSARCIRCTTIRRDVINKKGELSDRHYDYPNGYLIAGRLAMTMKRLELRKALTLHTNGKKPNA